MEVADSLKKDSGLIIAEDDAWGLRSEADEGECLPEGDERDRCLGRRRILPLADRDRSRAKTERAPSYRSTSE